MNPDKASGRIPPPQLKRAASNDAVQRFTASMTMDYDKWHDGVGYDLEALRAIPSGELASIAAMLIRHAPRDWRDVEALAQIDLPEAKQAVIAALSDSDPAVRRAAQRHLPEAIDPRKREAQLIKALKTAAPYAGLTQALAEVEEFHPPAVIDALFRGALHGPPESAVHYAAMLFYLHGKAKEAFDWDHRPFFLTFNETNPERRAAVFRELCAVVGVDGERYL